jgi:hypothetical protein
VTQAASNPGIKFAVRPCADPAGGAAFYCQILAVTPSGECFYLLHAECDEDEDDPIRRPAIRKLKDVTLAYARRMWEDCPDMWHHDETDGAGIRIQLK